MKSKEQQLIDMMFQIAYAITENKELKDKTYSEKALWIGEQLSKCGFKGGPLGSSWFYLEK